MVSQYSAASNKVPELCCVEIFTIAFNTKRTIYRLLGTLVGGGGGGLVIGKCEKEKKGTKRKKRNKTEQKENDVYNSLL